MFLYEKGQPCKTRQKLLRNANLNAFLLRTLRGMFSDYAGNEHRKNAIRLKHLRDGTKPINVSIKLVQELTQKLTVVPFLISGCMCALCSVSFWRETHSNQVCAKLYSVLSRYVSGGSRKNKLSMVMYIPVFQVRNLAMIYS